MNYLEVEAISAAYGERPVLHSVSFELAPGNILGVIGPNGAGKTSLIRALSGVLPLQAGQVRVMGRSVEKLSPIERARLVAVVPQARQLPAVFTGREVVLLGRTPHLNWLGQTSRRDEELARSAMRRTNTLDLAERRVGELSGGEQQRLLLARALAQAAPVLLLDEPTTHLDLQYQVRLLEQVQELVRQDELSALIVLHDLNLVARYADQVALLVGGELGALGNPNEVLNPRLLSQVYQIPLQVIRDGQARFPLVIPA